MLSGGLRDRNLIADRRVMSSSLFEERNCQRTKYLARRIADYIASTIVEVKPATLMKLSNRRDKVFELWDELGKALFAGSHLGYFELRRSDRGAIILFFSYRRLNELLNHKKIREFLRFLGYESALEPEDILCLFKKRYDSDSFPHEIGVLLGFPLKDVKAFMGMTSLSCTRVGMWKVYGEPESSVRLMGKYRRARAEIQRRLLMMEDPVCMIRGTV